eukprot:5105775-Lingulodinium_polyedra.AAC.1
MGIARGLRPAPAAAPRRWRRGGRCSARPPYSSCCTAQSREAARARLARQHRVPAEHAEPEL